MLISLRSIYKTSVMKSLKDLWASLAREASISARLHGSELSGYTVVSPGGFQDRTDQS